MATAKQKPKPKSKNKQDPTPWNRAWVAIELLTKAPRDKLSRQTMDLCNAAVCDYLKA